MLPYKNPLAYKQLRTWQQANEILELTEEFIKTLPSKASEKGHMDRSARSTVRNIEEGFRRTTTREYISFLGFSAGSNEELLGDFQHCLKTGKGDKKLALRGEYLCKGEGKMLFNQIKALENKMVREKTMSANDRARLILQKEKQKQKAEDRWLKRETARIQREAKGGKGVKGD